LKGRDRNPPVGGRGVKRAYGDRSGFGVHVLGSLVGAEASPARVSEHAVAGALGVGDLADELRSRLVGVAGVAEWYVGAEGARLAF
jgi:hypothetical protein